ncbi:hypothetical protein EDD69_102248 [Thermolongibacillus altinsuensis]|uniref:Uncharacterized protein n=1 Tax=Thermolongibacillus altinsuensis TaxID=575256 RepID=A0A4R1QJK1_9BACL|nr:hypothetical protein [Thermolongibacillus altinsuensis]TCL52841.1 hypothetical protein EDD69_102248 [Thermolongibacillus altinsuensis]
MDKVVVRTKSELKDAVQAGIKNIIIQGDLAEKVNKSFKLKKVSKITLGILTASLAATPITGGLSTVAAVPIATLTGLEIAIILAIAYLGTSLVLSLIKEYKVVKVRVQTGGKEMEIELEKE